MSYKTIYTEVDVDLYEWNDKELIKEMEHRGYTVVKDIAEDFDREDYDYLIEMLDKIPYSWYTRRIRDKLFAARYKEPA